MQVDFDVSQLRFLARDLLRSGPEVQVAVHATTQKAALNIKKATQARWAGSMWAPSLAAAVSYETRVTRMEVIAEIGPDKGKRQGALGNIYEYGTRNNAPIPALGPAFEAEVPNYVKWLGIAAGEATL